MKTPHKHADLIKAWADGVEIEAWVPCSGWELNKSPSWSNLVLYRLKPTRKPTTVTWHRLWASGEIANSYPHQPTTTNPHCQALLRIEIDHNDPCHPVLPTPALVPA